MLPFFFRWIRGFLLDFISFNHWTEVFSFINKPSLFFFILKFRTQQYIENLLSSSKLDLFLHCHNLLSWIYYRVTFWARLLLAYCFQELPNQPPWHLTHWGCAVLLVLGWMLQLVQPEANRVAATHGGQGGWGSAGTSKQASSRAAQDQRWWSFCNTYEISPL